MADAWFETVAPAPQRALLWRLAKTLCPAGVENVLDDLGGGIDSALRDVGKASIHDLTPDDIVVPPGFTPSLGVATDRNS
jgi:pre-mycofactocin synthase